MRSVRPLTKGSHSATFLVGKQIKASDAIKKNPRQSMRLGFHESLPQLRLLAGRQGYRGMGLPPGRPNATQVWLLPLRHKLHLGNAAI